MSLSRYSAVALLNSLFGKTSNLGALASAPTIYVALLTAAPTDTSTGSTLTEATYTGYSRVSTAAGDWNTASAGSPSSLTNANAVTFGACTAGTSTCTYFALVDAATNGNVIAFGALTSTYVAAVGNTPSFAASALTTTAA